MQMARDNFPDFFCCRISVFKVVIVGSKTFRFGVMVTNIDSGSATTLRGISTDVSLLRRRTYRHQIGRRGRRMCQRGLPLTLTLHKTVRVGVV